MYYQFTHTPMREIECDTFVAGGGVAGASAAIASARGGAVTVLAEAGATLGGQAGIGLVTPLSSARSRSGIRFGGLVDEIIDKVSALTKKYICVDENEKEIYSVSPHILRYTLLKLVSDANVHIHFHTVLCDVETQDGKIVSAILRDKTGFLKVRAKTFIDATGDADLVWLAGDEYVLGSEKGIFKDLIENNLDKIHSDGDTYDEYECDHMMQPVSLFFVMRGVDYNTASKLNNKNRYFGDLGITRERFEQWEFAGTPGFEITSDYVPMPQNRVLVSRGRHKDEAVINMSRIININGADADDLSRGEVMAQLQLIAIVDFLKTFIPGFEKSYLVETSTRLGVRETRRLCGKYKIQGNDLINCKKFDDAICKGFYMIDIHDPQGKRNAIGGEIKGDYFEIPYGALCSKNFSNLLACGRCISSDHIAHSATRIQGTCILTGQAAGCAAALSKEENIPPCDLNVHILRAKLVENNVNLH